MCAQVPGLSHLKQVTSPAGHPGDRYEDAGADGPVLAEVLAGVDPVPDDAGVLAEVAKLQARARAVIHRTPQPRFSPG